MSKRSSISRRASQTLSSLASNRYIRGEDVSAVVRGVDRFDVEADANEADEATSWQVVLKADAASIPAKPPGAGVRAGTVLVLRRRAWGVPMKSDNAPVGPRASPRCAQHYGPSTGGHLVVAGRP
jgi:hypothetical protein